MYKCKNLFYPQGVTKVTSKILSKPKSKAKTWPKSKAKLETEFTACAKIVFTVIFVSWPKASAARAYAHFKPCLKASKLKFKTDFFPKILRRIILYLITCALPPSLFIFTATIHYYKSKAPKLAKDPKKLFTWLNKNRNTVEVFKLLVKAMV